MNHCRGDVSSEVRTGGLRLNKSLRRRRPQTAPCPAPGAGPAPLPGNLGMAVARRQKSTPGAEWDKQQRAGVQGSVMFPPCSCYGRHPSSALSVRSRDVCRTCTRTTRPPRVREQTSTPPGSVLRPRRKPSRHGRDRRRWLVSCPKTQVVVLSQWARDATGITIKVDGASVEERETLDPLGVILDRLLHFGPHCKKLKQRSRPRIEHLRRLTGWGRGI